MRKFIVVITLLYTAATGAALGFMSNGFQELPALAWSPIASTLVLGLPVALVVAIIAYWKYNEWLTLALAAIVIGSTGYVLKAHHDAYGEWLPSLASGVETSGTAVLDARGQSLRYRLELHNPGVVTHREYLVVTRGGQDLRLRLPVFGDTRSGYVSAKTPNDWIVLRPAPEADVYHAETGRFLFVRKTFRINLQTREVTALATKPEN